MNRISKYPLLALFLSEALCADPLLESYAEMGFYYDDNTFFSAEEQQDESSADLHAGLVFTNSTEALLTRIEPAIKFHESFSDSSLNEIAPSLEIESRSQSERAVIGFVLRVQKDSTRVSETVSADNSSASGIVVKGKDRLFISASPNWLYRLTPTRSVSVNFTFSESDYNNASDVGLYDYDFQSLDARLVQGINERTEIWVGPSYLRYTSFERDSSSTTSGLAVGIKTNAFERLVAGGRLGWVSTDFRVNQEKSTSGSISAESYLEYRWELGSSKAFYRYDISPSGIGELNKSNSIGTDIDIRYSSFLETNLSVGYVQKEVARSTASNEIKESFYISPALTIKMARNSFLKFSLNFDSEIIENITKDRLQAGIQYIYRPAGKYL